MAEEDIQDLENNAQTDPIAQDTEAVQVDKPNTNEKGTDGKFSINKVQIRKTKPPTYKQSDKDFNYLSSVPNVKPGAKEYTPMPYTFRVPSPTIYPVRIRNLTARSPPFYLLLDHTIAVLWLLFAEKEYNSPLGIAQLQWALSFLKTIHSREGDLPTDVRTCVEAIENILLSSYGNLSKEMTNLQKLDDSIHYADGAFGSNAMLSLQIPFSLNYAEMIQKCFGSYGDTPQKSLSITSAQAEEELENIKKAAGVDSVEKLDSVSREKAINLLRLWKNDQVEKIREELRRLRKIEDDLKDIDHNFEGYIEDDLDKLTTD